MVIISASWYTALEHVFLLLVAHLNGGVARWGDHNDPQMRPGKVQLFPIVKI
jgi:hypothetical protein